MNLLPAEGDEFMTHRLVSENDVAHMFVYRAIYGWRVRAGFTDDMWGVRLDWCGGSNWKDVERLYSLTKAILTNRVEDRNCFNNLPICSMVKPFFLDEEFTEIVVKAAGECELVTLEQPAFQIPKWLQ